MSVDRRLSGENGSQREDALIRRRLRRTAKGEATLTADHFPAVIKALFCPSRQTSRGLQCLRIKKKQKKQQSFAFLKYCRDFKRAQ